jgi:hypothetical protein
MCSVDGLPISVVEPAYVGICAKELNQENEDQPDTWTVVERLAAAGAVRVGNRIRWDWVEIAPGTFDWQPYDERFALLRGSGMEPVITVRGTPAWASTAPHGLDHDLYPPADLEDWRAFLRELVGRYSSMIGWWEIWNEPNQWDFFRGSWEEYLEILDAGYEAIKESDPTSVVVAPSIALHPWNPGDWDFVELVMDQGSFDVFSVHLYMWEVADMYDAVVALRAELDARGLQSVPLIVDELNHVDLLVDCVGYSARPPEYHAELLRDYYACLGNAGAEGVFWFKSTDTGTRCDDGSVARDGVLDSALQPKAAYWELRGIADFIRNLAPNLIFADGFESGTTGEWVVGR